MVTGSVGHQEQRWQKFQDGAIKGTRQDEVIGLLAGKPILRPGAAVA
jgi:hypothetical protein